MMEITDFIQGQKDCAEGIQHKSGMSADYDRGYSTQYELEQVMSNESKRAV